MTIAAAAGGAASSRLSAWRVALLIGLMESRIPLADFHIEAALLVLQCLERVQEPPLLETRVRLTGLVAKPQLNGKMGHVVGYNRASARYSVALEGSKSIVSLRPPTPSLANRCAQLRSAPTLECPATRTSVQ